MFHSDLKIPETHPLNAKNVVIAGAGPIGLIATIVLFNRGMKNITLIDQWMGECTRAHEVLIGTYDEVKAIISPFKLVYGPHDGIHAQFKDMEKQLYDIVKSLGISLIKKNFHYYSSARKIVIIEKDSAETEEIELTDNYIFIDCTGDARAALRQYNKQQSEPGSPHFMIEPLTSTQEPKMFAKMRVIGDQKAFMKFNKGSLESFQSSIENYFLLKGELDKMGWGEAQLPWTAAITRPKKKSAQTKGHVYMELPQKCLDNYLKDKKSITEQDIIQYSKLLFKLTNNTMDEIKFELQKTKKPNKKMISTFVSNPQKTNPPFLLENKEYPFMMHLGDASVTLPFYRGIGLLWGVMLLRDILNFFEIEDGIIKVIHTKKWYDHYKDNLKIMKETTDSTYDEINDNTQKRLNHLKMVLCVAYFQSNDKTMRDLILKKLKEIDPLIYP